MKASAKLRLYGLLLAAVLVGSMVIGAAVAPVGLSNAEPAAAHDGMASSVEGAPGLAAAADGLQLRLADTLPVAQPATVSFTVTDRTGPVTRFGVEHTKRMLLVVDGEKHTLGTDLFVGGDFTPEEARSSLTVEAQGGSR